MADKIYTRSGDKGETSLGEGRISKDNIKIEVLGNIDELNSIIGANDEDACMLIEELHNIQRDLLTIGALLSTSKGQLDKDRIKDMEKKIDLFSEKLPELKDLILPLGYLHIARTVCRRVERTIVKLSKQEDVPPEILAYFNRLSDLLFVMARYSHNLKGLQDVTWK
jgi:cob(I)alamin adenosyltransferase